MYSFLKAFLVLKKQTISRSSRSSSTSNLWHFKLRECKNTFTLHKSDKNMGWTYCLWFYCTAALYLTWWVFFSSWH